MEVLVNSYSETAALKRQSAKFSFSQASKPRGLNSIVVSVKPRIGINSRILGLLNSYRRLEENWDLDDALAPTSKVIKTAEDITNVFQKIGQKIYHSAPGPNGEIMLDVRDNKNSKSLEIIVYNDKINIVFIPEREFPSQEVFNFRELKNYLNWLNKN